MKLEEGKRYVRRDGLITGYIEYDPDDEVYPEQPWWDPDHGNYYLDDGLYLLNNGTHPWDLIAEYVEPRSKTDRKKLCALFDELNIGYVLSGKVLLSPFNSPVTFVFRFDEQGNLIRGE